MFWKWNGKRVGNGLAFLACFVLLGYAIFLFAELWKTSTPASTRASTAVLAPQELQFYDKPPKAKRAPKSFDPWIVEYYKNRPSAFGGGQAAASGEQSSDAQSPSVASNFVA